MGDLNTIAGGFSRGEVFSAVGKCYARSVMQLATKVALILTPSFTREDLKDVFPHDNDLVVILIVMKSRRIHRVLVDQGSSRNVLFWNAFVAMGGSVDELEPYKGVGWFFRRLGSDAGLSGGSDNL